ncbi:MAG TPA: hypothetical protein VF145_06720 [Chitinophagaceae bacterium]
MKYYFKKQYWKDQRLLLLVFLLLHIVIASVFISRQSITFDEMDYYAYSVHWAKGKAERTNRMYDSKTPLMVVAAIPRAIRQLVSPHYRAMDNGASDILAGRYVMVIFTIVAALYLFRWIRILFPGDYWIIPLLFFLFDPMVISYSMIITSDMASGACLLATAFHFYRFFFGRSRLQLFYFSAWLAAGLLCKASLLYIIPLLLLVGIIYSMVRPGRQHLAKLMRAAAVSTLITLLILNLSFYFAGTGQALSATQWKSALFKSLSSAPLISDIPVPLPKSYLQGVDLLQYHGDLGAGYSESTHHGTYVNGKIKYQGGFWYYYLYVGFYKLPIATLVLLFVGIIAILVSGRGAFRRTHCWYVIPLLFFSVVLSLFNPFQSGFRHFLLVYPFIFMAIAAGCHFFGSRRRIVMPVAFVLFLPMIVSAAVYFPWLMSYTNEFTGPKKLVFRKINDSSISYGQNRRELRKFLAEHPDYQGMPVEPKAGKFIVSATELTDFKSGRDCSWLTAFTPVAHYQYSMYLFEVSAADLRKLQQNSRQ